MSKLPNDAVPYFRRDGIQLYRIDIGHADIEARWTRLRAELLAVWCPVILGSADDATQTPTFSPGLRWLVARSIAVGQPGIHDVLVEWV